MEPRIEFGWPSASFDEAPVYCKIDGGKDDETIWGCIEKWTNLVIGSIDRMDASSSCSGAKFSRVVFNESKSCRWMNPLTSPNETSSPLTRA